MKRGNNRGVILEKCLVAVHANFTWSAKFEACRLEAIEKGGLVDTAMEEDMSHAGFSVVGGVVKGMVDGVDEWTVDVEVESSNGFVEPVAAYGLRGIRRRADERLAVGHTMKGSFRDRSLKGRWRIDEFETTALVDSGRDVRGVNETETVMSER